MNPDPKSRLVLVVLLLSIYPFPSVCFHTVLSAHIFFGDVEGLQQTLIHYCANCSSLAVALLEQGLFPSTPLQPYFVFDLNLLDSVSTLFLYTAPNVEAWCLHLADTLARKGYYCKQVSLICGTLSSESYLH
jgi:hypothetical protein